MGKKEEIFRKNKLFTADELRQSFDLIIEHIESDDSNYAGVTKEGVLKLCEKFKDAIKSCALPNLSELWWYYEHQFTNDGINLNLCLAEDIEIDEDEYGSYVSSETTTTIYNLLSVTCDYLTVEKFAELHKVSPITVRQWIRRGKLRTAKKLGRSWAIPVLEDKPQRGFESVRYILNDPVSIDIQNYPLLSLCDSVNIYQDDNSKDKFVCDMYGAVKGVDETVFLTRKEAEQLEHDLIASGHAEVDGRIRCMPIISKF